MFSARPDSGRLVYSDLQPYVIINRFNPTFYGKYLTILTREHLFRMQGSPHKSALAVNSSS